MIHIVKGKPKTSGRKPRSAAVTRPGFFLYHIKRHNWPPQFEPAAVWTSTAALSAKATEGAEARKGHAGHGLHLPGSLLYGPIGKMR